MIGKLEININRNAMSVSVSVRSGGNTEITEELLRNELLARGIVAGIHQETISEIAECGIYNKLYIVANGESAVCGQGGYYEFFFDKDLKENAPTIREDGSVDYSPVIQLVEKSQLLAEYHHAVEGATGYTIFGSPIAPIPSRELPELQCENVERVGDKYYAAIKGKVSLNGNKLTVKNCLDIDGDVGYHMRTITFNGDVHIHGDVLNDVTINADGNVEVDGVIEGATIHAGRDIIVHHGIHGMDKAVIEAGGSVTTNFIEEADVRAVGSIVVDHIINANVVSQNGVFAQGRSGQILGGKVTAELCDAYQIGNDSGKVTNIYLRSLKPDRSEAVALIVRKKMCEGVGIEINDVKLEPSAGSAGEFHCTEDGITKCKIGEYQYKAKKKPEQKTDEKSEKPLILIVDDDPVVLKNEYMCLADQYRVAAVSTAKDALAFLQKAIPDLILLDYLMPQMNGGRLLERIRFTPNKAVANIPVFFLTSVTDKEIVAECLKLYPQGYLIKPLGKEELQKIVGDFFAKIKRNKQGVGGRR